MMRNVRSVFRKIFLLQNVFLISEPVLEFTVHKSVNSHYSTLKLTTDTNLMQQFIYYYK